MNETNSFKDKNSIKNIMAELIRRYGDIPYDELYVTAILIRDSL